MLNIIIFGPPGSGKGTQSEKIIEKYGLVHISTGDILREEIRKESMLGKLAAEFINEGELVPDHIIIEMLENKLDELNNAKSVIYDGFPRTIEQAVSLKEMLNKRNEKISVMFNLEVDEQELIDRLLKRGETSGRADDNLKTIEKRIQIYEDQTAPVIGFYKNEGCYKGIQGVGSVNDIFGRISEVVDAL